MFALARFLIMATLVLAVIYGSLWMYLRARRRDLLEIDWAANPSQTQSRDDFISEGLAEHDRKRHRTLVALVFALPLGLLLLIVYLTNFH